MIARPLPTARRIRCALTLLPSAFVATVLIALGCANIDTDPHSVASISLDTIPSPAVVAHDSLRDTLGIARPLHATAYNPEGAALTGTPIVYLVVDSGARADSARGYVVADTARTSPVRVVAEAGGLQTMPDTLWVVPAPDSVTAVNPADTLAYSLSDSTRNVSTGLVMKVMHRNGTSTPDAVRGWIVSFRIVAPIDTMLAQIVGDNGRTSLVDTTASDGTASRQIRVRPIRLTSPNDSVIVDAMVRYRGSPIAGTPIRFILQVKPGT